MKRFSTRSLLRKSTAIAFGGALLLPGLTASSTSVYAARHDSPSPDSAVQAQSVMTVAGQSLAFSKVIDVRATAYSDSPEENGKWGPVDFFGDRLKLGTVAVDPKVIPLGSKLYVTGYTFGGLPVGGFVGKAKDIGGAIKGKRIDIYVPGSRSFVSAFGVQNVKIYVLK